MYFFWSVFCIETQFRAEIKAALNPQQSIDLSVLQWTENHAQKRLEIMQKVGICTKYDYRMINRLKGLRRWRLLEIVTHTRSSDASKINGQTCVKIRCIAGWSSGFCKSAPKRIGGFADIYKGEMDGRAVAIKHLHSWVVLRPSERDKLTWVRWSNIIVRSNLTFWAWTESQQRSSDASQPQA